MSSNRMPEVPAVVNAVCSQECEPRVTMALDPGKIDERKLRVFFSLVKHCDKIREVRYGLSLKYVRVLCFSCPELRFKI